MVSSMASVVDYWSCHRESAQIINRACINICIYKACYTVMKVINNYNIYIPLCNVFAVWLSFVVLYLLLSVLSLIYHINPIISRLWHSDFLNISRVYLQKPCPTVTKKIIRIICIGSYVETPCANCPKIKLAIELYIYKNCLQKQYCANTTSTSVLQIYLQVFCVGIYPVL